MNEQQEDKLQGKIDALMRAARAPGIAQTLCVGTIESQLRFAANVAQELLEQRDELVAALQAIARFHLDGMDWTPNDAADAAAIARAALARAVG